MTTTDTLIVYEMMDGNFHLGFSNGATDGSTESEVQMQDPAKSLGKAAPGRIRRLQAVSSVGSILDFLNIDNGQGAEIFKLRLRESNIPVDLGWDIPLNTPVDDGATMNLTTSD